MIPGLGMWLRVIPKSLSSTPRPGQRRPPGPQPSLWPTCRTTTARGRGLRPPFSHMSTLGDMKHRIAEELRRTTLSGQITNAIKSAIAGYENRRFFFNEYADTIITTGGTDSVALPDDLLKIDAARLSYGSRPRRLRQVTQGEMSARRDPNVTGVPVEFAVRQQGMALYPVPDAAYSIEIEYVRKLPDLASDADS